MSVKQTGALWLRECEPKRKHLLHAICDCADDDGRAFPSVNYLVWKTDLPRSTVIQYMQEFRKLGVLECAGRRSEIEHGIRAYSERDTAVVWVHLDKLPAKVPWRKKGKEASPAAGLGESSDRTTVVQRQGGNSPVAGGAIRKNLQEPSENQYPPTPLPGGLNSRDRRNVAKELARIYQASVGVYQDADFEERVVRTVSAGLVLPLDDVRAAIAKSRSEIPGQVEMGGCESAPT